MYLTLNLFQQIFYWVLFIYVTGSMAYHTVGQWRQSMCGSYHPDAWSCMFHIAVRARHLGSLVDWLLDVKPVPSFLL